MSKQNLDKATFSKSTQGIVAIRPLRELPTWLSTSAGAALLDGVTETLIV